jgi:hypothetical protein
MIFRVDWRKRAQVAREISFCAPGRDCVSKRICRRLFALEFANRRIDSFGELSSLPAYRCLNRQSRPPAALTNMSRPRSSNILRDNADGFAVRTLISLSMGVSNRANHADTPTTSRKSKGRAELVRTVRPRKCLTQGMSRTSTDVCEHARKKGWRPRPELNRRPTA